MEHMSDSLNINYKIIDNSINVSKDVAHMLSYENYVTGTTISLNLLNLILENQDFFDYAVLVFSGNIRKFSISVTDDPQYDGIKYLAKKHIYEAFKEAIRYNEITLTDETRKRFHILKEMMYIDFFEQCHQDDTFEIEIEGANYKIEVKNFFALLRTEPLEFESILKKEETLYDIKKEYFLYALKKYYNKNFIETSYLLTPNIETNFASIMVDEYVDTAAINKEYKHDPVVDEYEVNKELEEYIMSGISPDFTLLEKAIYIYIKLCKSLTYDEEFYAAHQKGDVALKHKNIRHLKDISLTNNSVVCWEFNAIFSYLLNKLGINSGTNVRDYAYGDGHNNVEFRCDKYLVIADAVTSIFTGDLYNAKLNKPIVGLGCHNRNVDTRIDFERSVDKVYEYIKNEELFEHHDLLKEGNLNELLLKYKKYTENYKELPIPERVAILFEKVNSMKRLKGMDTYSYIMQLGKIFFKPEERDYNIKFELIKNNEPKEEEKETMPLGVLAVNPVLFSKVSYENSYYIYSSKYGFEPISYFTLKERFENGTYEYMNGSRQGIPGIFVKKEKTL